MRFFTKNKIALIAEVANAHGGNLEVAKKITEPAQHRSTSRRERGTELVYRVPLCEESLTRPSRY